jgi:hypothetical protein
VRFEQLHFEVARAEAMAHELLRDDVGDAEVLEDLLCLDEREAERAGRDAEAVGRAVDARQREVVDHEADVVEVVADDHRSVLAGDGRPVLDPQPRHQRERTAHPQGRAAQARDRRREQERARLARA